MKILFIGDSITDAGRTNDKPPLGDGYVQNFTNMLKQEFHAKNFSIINKGICGNTIEGLNLRWKWDVINQKPDLLFILIGINDVHITQAHPLPEDQRITHFESLYSSLILKTKEVLPGCTIVLLSPFYICRNKKNPVRITTEKYRKTIQSLSILHKLSFIDLHNLFQTELIEGNEEKWSRDKVHPTPEGHYFIAGEIFKFFKESSLCRGIL